MERMQRISLAPHLQAGGRKDTRVAHECGTRVPLTLTWKTTAWLYCVSSTQGTCTEYQNNRHQTNALSECNKLLGPHTFIGIISEFNRGLVH